MTQGDIEPFFGVVEDMHQASLRPRRAGAQWSGITTRLGESLLERGEVTAVLCIGADPDDRWRPIPKLITSAEEMASCRGMRMGYAPLLELLEPAIEAGHRRLAVIGIPCQIYALRALEKELDLEHLVVIGTPCSDNTTTENFHEFLSLLDAAPETINYLEFMPDFHVERRFENGAQRRIPFLQLPIADLRDDFFPLTCRTCVDYVNTLADITVGYMGGRGEQWLIVRNARGQQTLDHIQVELSLKPPTTGGKRKAAVQGFIDNTRQSDPVPLHQNIYSKWRLKMLQHQFLKAIPMKPTRMDHPCPKQDYRKAGLPNNGHTTVNNGLILKTREATKDTS